MESTVKIRLQAGVLSVLAVVILTAFLFFLGNAKFNTPNLYPLVQLDDGWTISRGSDSWEPESISASSTGIANDGDIIVLSRSMPEITLNPTARRASADLRGSGQNTKNNQNDAADLLSNRSKRRIIKAVIP